MKPLPTLTKPLRSVDTETKRAGRGAARAHRLVHGAGGRRGRRGDGRARARPTPTARSSAATTSTTCAARRAPTRANRVAAPLSLRRERSRLALGLHRLHGRREVDRRPQRRRGARASTAIDIDALMEQRLGKPIADVFEQRRRGGVPRARGGAVALELLEHRRRRRCRPRRRRDRLIRAVRAALAATSRRCWLDVPRDRLGALPRAASGRWPATATQFERAATPSASRSTRQLADAIVPVGALDVAIGPACCAALRGGCPAGAKLLWAASASGDYPVFVGAGLLDAAPVLAGHVPGRRFLRDRRQRRPALRRDRGAALPDGSRSCRARQSKTVAHAERVLDASSPAQG